jgi:hypothetical protein
MYRRDYKDRSSVLVDVLWAAGAVVGGVSVLFTL